MGTREIRDQVYDEKQNKVQINVISCCPERILEKIACKGGKTVEGIEIVPEKKKEGEKPKEGEKKKEGDKPKEGEKKKDAPADKPKDGEKKKEGGGDKPKDGEKKEAVVHKHMAEPVSGYPTIYPSGMYYQPPPPYYQGYGAMPYYHGVPAYYGEGSYGVNRGYNTNRCCDYFSEENPDSCTVM